MLLIKEYDLSIGTKFKYQEIDRNKVHTLSVEKDDNHNLCDNCFFNDIGTCGISEIVFCYGPHRKDETNVVFKEVKDG